MFDLFSWQHILILLVVMLVVVGPKDLPRLMHMMGKWAAKARAMANEFRKSFDEMARQAELDELRREIEDLKKNNPITEMANTMADVGATMSATAPLEAEATPSVEGTTEPRSGELAVTDAPAPEQVKVAEPVKESSASMTGAT